jgi:hypothetical protein
MTAHHLAGFLLTLALVLSGVLVIASVWPPSGLRTLACSLYGGLVALLIGTVSR